MQGELISSFRHEYFRPKVDQYMQNIRSFDPNPKKIYSFRINLQT